MLVLTIIHIRVTLSSLNSRKQKEVKRSPFPLREFGEQANKLFSYPLRDVSSVLLTHYIIGALTFNAH